MKAFSYQDELPETRYMPRLASSSSSSTSSVFLHDKELLVRIYKNVLYILSPLFSKQFYIRAERNTDVFGFCKHCNLSHNWSDKAVNFLSLIVGHIRKRRSQAEVAGKRGTKEKNETMAK